MSGPNIKTLITLAKKQIHDYDLLRLMASAGLHLSDSTQQKPDFTWDADIDESIAAVVFSAFCDAPWDRISDHNSCFISSIKSVEYYFQRIRS